MNGTADADVRAKYIHTQIRRLRKEPNSIKIRREIKRLYEELDVVQFKPDYMCLVIDREKDYLRACDGFIINGMKYHRLLGTNGGVKNSTVVFISDRHGDEIRRRIENGRNPDMELVPAKFEAYKALTCSASTPVSMPRGVIVVNDCETVFNADIVYLDDEQDGEPTMVPIDNAQVSLDESDGYGIMLPSLASRWASELQVDYLPSGVNTRFAWEKGMVFTFDFLEFAESVAGKYTVVDAWGVERDVRDAELILTTSMVKLWDSYDSCEAYLSNSLENGYSFGVTKVCPKNLESERNLNYQFIQSYELTDEDIEELVQPTIHEIQDVLGGDYRKTILFLRGVNLSAADAKNPKRDWITAVALEPKLINDPFIRNKVHQLIKKKITDAKVGVLKVHGNFSMVSGDPYSLCQNMFGLEVTGLLGAGEIYNAYWDVSGAEKLACFRAPMSCHNNVRLVRPCRSNDARHWYQYMTTCTVLNSWDTIAHALNGCD